jgi:ABC-2 type transport system permease protein
MGQLVRTLAVAEFKLRYLDAALSYFWGVARPLALFGVLYFVFTRVGNLSDGVKDYGLCLLTSIVLWTYFSEATGSAVPSLVRRGDLLRKVPFQRSAVPLAVTLKSLFDLAMNLIALFAFLLVSGVTPRAGWLELIPLLVLLTLLVAGMSLLLSALYVRFRDIDQVWLVVRQALFYATPVLYVASSLPDDIRGPFTANPLAAIFTQARHALVDPEAPTAAEVLGGTEWLLIPVGIVLLAFAAGVVVFRRNSARMAELL